MGHVNAKELVKWIDDLEMDGKPLPGNVPVVVCKGPDHEMGDYLYYERAQGVDDYILKFYVIFCPLCGEYIGRGILYEEAEGTPI